MTPKTPSKRWRVITPERAAEFRGQQAAYDALNAYTADANVATFGRLATVWHWEDGDWRLYERARITENGWEPA